MESWDNYVYVQLPSEVQGTTYIRMARADVSVTDQDFMRFDLSEPSMLYIAQYIGGTVPDWLDGSRPAR
jgi:hypothetical protein